MKQMKKTLSCILALSIAASMFAVPVYADNEEEAGEALAAETETAAEETVEDAPPEPEVTAPAETGEENPADEPSPDALVTADGFTIEDGVLTGYSGTATEVVIPAGVVTIGNKAFQGNKSITSITIPDTVTSIQDGYKEYYEKYLGAFSDCTSLKTVNFGSGIEKIGNWAFRGCYNLEYLKLPDTAKYIGAKAFLDCSKLASVDISNTQIETIGFEAFGSCTTLVKFVMPDTVKELGESAFINCTKLALITLSNSLTSIKQRTFRNCTQLLKIDIPGSVTTIDDGEVEYYQKYMGAFYGCTNLKSVTLGEGVKKIGNHAFRECTSLNTVSFPSTLETIGDYAFFNCYSMKDPNFEDTSLTSIGEGAFRWCSSITKITQPDTLTDIGSYAFANCVNVASLTLSKRLKAISSAAFDSCSSLTTVEVPNSVTTIANGEYEYYEKYHGAFSHCTALQSITIGTGVKHIGVYAFFDCPKLKTFQNNSTSLTSIGNYAFWNCTALPKLDFGNSPLETIGEGAFQNCYALADIDLGKCITSISPKAFYNCKSITEIVLSDTFVVFSATTAFDGCASLSKIDLGQSMTSIECVFGNCDALNTLNISKELVSIKGNSFKGSPNIYTINYSGTKAQWEELLLLNSTSYLAKMKDQYIVHCADGDIRGQFYSPDLIVSTVFHAPTKTDYAIGEELDLSDCYFDVYYSGGTNKRVPVTKDMVKGFDNTLTGNQTITVTYGETTTTFKVTVSKAAKAVTGITLTPPIKTIYRVGEELDVTGAKLEVSYNDNTTQEVDVTADMVSGFDKNLAKVQVLTVTYQGKTATFTVTVRADDVTVTDVTLVAKPSKVKYTEGDPLDPTGGKIKITYSDKTYDTVAMTTFMIDGYDPWTTGPQTLTINYDGQVLGTYQITVEEKTELPTFKTSYMLEYPDGTFDTDVASFKACMSRIGNKYGEYKIYINSSAAKVVNNTGFSFPKNAKLSIIALSDTRIEIKEKSLKVNNDLDLQCEIRNNKNAAISFKCAKGVTMTIGKRGNYGTISGAKGSNLIIEDNLSVEAVKGFDTIDTGINKLTLTKSGISGIAVNSAHLVYPLVLAKKVSIPAVNNDLTITITDSITNGTTLFNYTGKELLDATKLSVTNTDGSRVLGAFQYKKIVRAEIPDLFLLDGEDCPSWEYAVSRMNDNEDHVIGLTSNLTLPKFSMPAKAKSITFEGNGYKLDLVKTKAITSKCPLILDNITVEATGTPVSLKAGSNNITVVSSNVGAITTTGKLTVDGTVVAKGAVSCAALTSEEVDTHFTVQEALSIGKGGVLSDSQTITLKIIDKTYGSPKTFQSGTKNNIVVKSYKASSFDPTLLLLDDKCGGKDKSLKLSRGKLIL